MTLEQIKLIDKKIIIDWDDQNPSILINNIFYKKGEYERAIKNIFEIFCSIFIFHIGDCGRSVCGRFQHKEIFLIFLEKSVDKCNQISYYNKAAFAGSTSSVGRAPGF